MIRTDLWMYRHRTEPRPYKAVKHFKGERGRNMDSIVEVKSASC